ncbi:MAG: hypothetical protein ACFWUC_10650 [Oscillospiraceae bacterium]
MIKLQAPEVLENENLSNFIADSLKKRIIMLDLFPGEKLSEMKIARMMACSRTPVRDAFHRLRSEGYLESHPQVGTFVPKIDLRRVEEVRFIREGIETFVLKFGMERNLFMPYFTQLQHLIDKQDRAYSANEYNTFNQLDIEFHHLFHHAINKPFVSHYSGDTDVHHARLRLMSIRYERNPHIAIEHHQQILDSVVANDIPKMFCVMEAHLNNLYRVLENPELINSAILK